MGEEKRDDATKEGWMTRTRGCPEKDVLAGGTHEAEGRRERRAERERTHTFGARTARRS